jgi:hypothetical protein
VREVYFDDFKVEHVKSPVISSQDYYPFGLTLTLATEKTQHLKITNTTLRRSKLNLA